MSSKFNFKFNKQLLNKGFYTANYFIKTSKLIKKYKPNEIVCMQFTHFSKEPVMVCGIEESVELIKSCLTKQELKDIEIYGQQDGTIVSPKNPILLIFGKYHVFGKFENVIDGILARRSSVANNCRKVLSLIDANKLIYMADRTDDYLVQPYDGYAAYVGGIRRFVTDASVSLLKDKSDVSVGGTIPHALIQEFDGNLNEALKAYSNEYGRKGLVALIDYHNDIRRDIKSISKDFNDCFAIRIDTSKNVCDQSLKPIKANYGVSDSLIKFARHTLDQYGMKQTKIVVSSGIDYDRVKQIVDKKLPVDFYGIGSNLITRNVHITADLVLKNGHHEAKFGRKLFININKKNSLKKYI